MLDLMKTGGEGGEGGLYQSNTEITPDSSKEGKDTGLSAHL